MEYVTFYIRKSSIFKRVCLQTILKKNFLYEIVNFINILKEFGVDLPTSIAITPVPKDVLKKLKLLGIDRIGIGLDVATPKLFERMKKPYSWDIYWRFIDRSIRILGKITVHLIFGLGESLVDFLTTMTKVISQGADVALFPYTPIKDLKVSERPELEVYRVVQAIRYLLTKGYKLNEIIELDEGKLVIKDLIYDVPLDAFLTSGCPNCNRPFYTESPLKIYNYPSFNLLVRDKNAVYEQLNRGVLELSAKR